MNQDRIILASSSPYRKTLLERLQIEFTIVSPDIDEQRFQNESVNEYVVRLAEEKAKCVASNHPDAIVIGADQAVECDGKILGKPENHDNAKQQLMAMSNKSLSFYTGIYVINTKTKLAEKDVIIYRVSFRNLSEIEIEDYLDKERPYLCAGSFMSEKLGISLLTKMEGADPTALIGLPLIRLCEMLRNQGMKIP
ncbi:MAG: Maf family protein [Proteobacteria bacterium]|nr:Maf family protein [Pseudomonadota bacterium]